jgi:Ca-activated chloride channel family protein
MSRAHRTHRKLAFGIVALSAAGAGAAAPPAPAVVTPFSPSKVLAQLAGKTGGVGFATPYGQGERPEADRSLAPYLTVVGAAGNGTEQVPLKETSADVSIAGVIARVQVHQVFENTGRTPIEAVYVFPASTRAAVHGARMKIGGRTIEAHIDRKAAARESYETARREGRRASLLEQERPNVFTMNVANIMPGDRIGVDLDYSEMLVPEDAVYELVYPTVVGPRYAGGADPARDKWMANPHLPAGTPEPYKFDIRVHLESGVPIKELASPSHQIAVNYAGPSRADVRLAVPGGGNRDFVLRYRLAGNKIESGLLLWEGEGRGGQRENFFALMMEPPQRPTAAEIPPREYVFLLDVSGSMYGFPLDTAKALMRNLLGRLRPTDYFDVALFSGAARVLSPGGSMPARKEEIARAIADIEKEQGGGGTELMGGLEMAYKIPKRTPGISRTVVVVTDGYVGVEAQAFRFIRERLSEANLFAFGIGSAVNRGLIEGMARAGQGEPFVVLRPDKAAAEADKLRAYVEEPVLANVGVAFSGFDAYEVAPQKLPDLMARRPLVLYGKYRGAPGGKIEITGATGRGRFRQAVNVGPAGVRSENAALRWLWARRWVDTLEDERSMGAGQPAEDGITALGLDYSLLTAFTSFVAVDTQVVNQGGNGKSVRQPLPMPEGVSNLAVGGDAPASSSAPAMGATGIGAPAHRVAAQKSKAPGRAPATPALAPQPAPVASKDDDAQRDLDVGGRIASGKHARRSAEDERKEEKNDRRPAAREPAAWRITAGGAVGIGATEPLVVAVRAALAGDRGACLAAAAARKTWKLRLTVDAHGKVVRVDVVAGDQALAACLRASLAGLSSSTFAAGGATGSVVLTLVRS